MPRSGRSALDGVNLNLKNNNNHNNNDSNRK